MKPIRTKIIGAKKQPIAKRDTVRLTFTIGPKEYVHEFHVLGESEADCLIGLHFPRANKCDPLISKDRQQLDESTQVPLYHRKNERK